MIALVQDRLAELETACQRYAVRRLALFGSAAAGTFVPETSDLDFLVEFAPLPPIRRAQCYFELLLELEQLFGRSVDLIDVAAIRNPYFAQAVNAGQEVLYAA
jgi:uncharacterized protein